jgi:hypothetical protein
MTTGTTEPYLKRPEDINPPKPGYFHDVFHLVHAYIEVLKHVPESAVPARGLVKLYSYRTGTLTLDTDLLEATYFKSMQGNRSQQTMLRTFGQGMITYNLLTLYQLLSNTLMRDMTRAFGDDLCLSSELVHAMNHFSKAQSRRPPNDTTRMQIGDGMGALVETCHYNAYYPRGCVSSSEAIIRTIDALDKVVVRPTQDREVTQRMRLINALKIVFYIGVRYYHLNLLRFSDEIINRSYDRVLDITDFTLAAIPFDPTLIYACSDNTSAISRWGIEYVQSLEAVLLYAGGVRYQATLAVEANGNKGVNNV